MLDRLVMSKTIENHMQIGKAEALRRVRERLRTIDLAGAVERCGLTINADGNIEAALSGRSIYVAPDTLAVTAADGGAISPVDELLVLRYLEAKRDVVPTGRLISFRDLPGGGFYHAPVLRRTSGLVVRAYGNDVDELLRALESFPHELLDLGDVSARIRAIGRIDLTLIYRIGDEEFPASADVLYDAVIASIFNTDEIAALATNLCVGLMRLLRARGQAG